MNTKTPEDGGVRLTRRSVLAKALLVGTTLATNVRADAGSSGFWLDRARAEDFRPRRGERFRLRGAGGAKGILELVEVRLASPDPGRPRGLRREPFALLFRVAGETEETELTQDTYVLRHPHLGTFSLFLVPVGPFFDGGRPVSIQLEAVFN